MEIIKPQVLHLGSDLELKQRTKPVPLETRLVFSYLGHLHVRDELGVVLHEPERALHWENKRLIALAEAMQMAGMDLQPIHDHADVRKQKAIEDHRNQYVRDEASILSLEAQTIGGNPPSIREITGKVIHDCEQLEPLFYAADWLTKQNDNPALAAPYIWASIDVLSALCRMRNEGYHMHTSEISKGFGKTNVLLHRLGKPTTHILSMAETWLAGIPEKHNPYRCYIALTSGMIESDAVHRAVTLASRLHRNGKIKRRDTRDTIYQEAALHLASEGKFDYALTVGEKITRGSKNPLMAMLYGDKAVYEATQGKDPQEDIDKAKSVIGANRNRVFPEGHLKIGVASFIYGKIDAAEAHMQEAWNTASKHHRLAQATIAETVDQLGYDAGPLYLQAMQQGSIPDAAIPHHRMKILEKLASGGYLEVASQFLSAVKPDYAVSVTYLSDLAKVELQQAPKPDGYTGLDPTKEIAILKEACPGLDLEMVNLWLSRDQKGLNF